jgi:hypothetical protein
MCWSQVLPAEPLPGMRYHSLSTGLSNAFFSFKLLCCPYRFRKEVIILHRALL